MKFLKWSENMKNKHGRHSNTVLDYFKQHGFITYICMNLQVLPKDIQPIRPVFQFLDQ